MFRWQFQSMYNTFINTEIKAQETFGKRHILRELIKPYAILSKQLEWMLAKTVVDAQIS